VFASLIAYCAVSSPFLHDGEMKLWTRWSKLWSRAVGSSCCRPTGGHNLLIVRSIRRDRAGGYVVTAAISAYFFKVAFEFAAIPLTYLVAGFLKRSEGVEVRLQSSFNPFHFGTHS